MQIPTHTTPRWHGAALLGAAGLAASFLYVQAKRKEVERAHPPEGKFIEVDGVRLHYVERGEGPALVLLHGNGVFAGDFALSGLLDAAAASHRVIAFDRPGFGYSDRPGTNRWTPEEQARLLYQALHQLRVENPVVVGHSWGTLVTLALALAYPRYVRAITLVSGYYYPSPRIDAALLAAPAVPGLGHLLRYTLAPLLGRIMWPALVNKVFGPAPVDQRFRALPVWMALRPSQIAASASESGMMVPAAKRLSQRYAELTMPVAVIAGSGDTIADPGHNALRFHHEVQHSDLTLAPGVGHMAHYAQPAQIMAAVARLEASLTPGGGGSWQQGLPEQAPATLH
jgi:pimeloyl-ACP methyl ester carboxylesterase